MSKKTSKKTSKAVDQLGDKPHICGVKLVSGEDIICILKLEKEQSRYMMQNPALIFLKEMDKDPEKFQIVFSPFCPAAHDGQISIVTDKLVGMYAPTTEIVEQYRNKYRHPGVSVPTAEPSDDLPPKFEG